MTPFKNHSFNVKMVKDTEPAPTAVNDPSRLWINIPDDFITKDKIRYAAGAIAAVVVSKKVLDTSCEIALIAARAKFH